MTGITTHLSHQGMPAKIPRTAIVLTVLNFYDLYNLCAAADPNSRGAARPGARAPRLCRAFDAKRPGGKTEVPAALVLP
ncbi:hypothetical protein GCM10018793_03520 [Streptomyces sulfonofaciens]|uniref:Uncharacterized protein n=1 Tax=Streptomyces sulfonofaciens TaxID=68272 RepID=A0A919FPU1_9ACTN|nr:hypothetical protein GCM10018793_03520 [Streptomyces sulfonofaciens]